MTCRPLVEGPFLVYAVLDRFVWARVRQKCGTILKRADADYLGHVSGICYRVTTPLMGWRLSQELNCSLNGSGRQSKRLQEPTEASITHCAMPCDGPGGSGGGVGALKKVQELRLFSRVAPKKLYCSCVVLLQAGRDEAAVAKAAKDEALAAKRERLKAALLAQQVAAIKAKKQQQQQKQQQQSKKAAAAAGSGGSSRAGAAAGSSEKKGS